MELDDTANLKAIDDSAASKSERERPWCLLAWFAGRVQVVRLEPGTPVTIGRAPTAGGIVIPDWTLSGEHARFTLAEGTVVVEDLGSTNGTSLNGRAILSAQMRSDDEVVMGATSVALHAMAPPEGQPHGVESHERFEALLQEEVVRAQTFSRRLALLLVGLDNESGAEPGHRLRQWYPRIRRLLRPVDRVGVFSAAVIEILLVETGLEEAAKLANRITEERQGEEPAVSCGIALFPDGARSAEELVERSRSALLRARTTRAIHAVGTHEFVLAAGGTPLAGDSGAGPVLRGGWMREALTEVDRVAGSALPVLITGETGTGKEVIARLVHHRSDRRDRPLQCVNCGAIPEGLTTNVLFGHERGAFTGADRPSKGVFQEAAGGTVFLDEVGELSLPAQVALLRVLETNRICRVGSTREIPVDVRVVCATHRDLEAMCEAGTFRRDLFYRINAVPVRIPPLRERRDEIRLLAEHFAHLASETNQREVKGIAPRALELLERYHWPGNIRELRNVIERAVVIARRPEISEDDLPERVRPDVLGQGDVSPPARPRRVTQSVPVPPILVDATAPSVLLGDRRKSTSDEEPGNRSLEARVQAFEISLIRRALHHTQGNQTKAAALLRIPRRTLIYKIGAYHIDETAPLPTGHADHQHLAATADGPIDFKERVQWFKADLVREALARCGGVAAEAGRLLGVTERVIWLEIQKHGLRGTYR